MFGAIRDFLNYSCMTFILSVSLQDCPACAELLHPELPRYELSRCDPNTKPDDSLPRIKAL